MRRSILMITTSITLLVAGAPGLARVRPEPKTEAGVLSASDAWIAAERLGDVAGVNARLVDGYVDVESNGKPHTKAELINHTATRKDIWPGTPAQVALAFHQKYPHISKVVIEGDTAVLSYYPADPKRPANIIAEDVFTYEHGMWKGIFSSHFAPPPAPKS